MSPDQTAIFQMVLRWLHLVGGVTWIGFLFFFNLVSGPFLAELDAPTRGRVFAPLMSRAMLWFRYSSLLTVFAGIWYWMMIVGADVRNARALHPGEHFSGGIAIGSFFLLWTLAWWVLSLVSAKGRLSLPIVLAAYIAVVSAASFLYVRMNDHGWESSRLLCIGIGGGMGWILIFNVWGIVWRNSKKLLKWSGQAGDDAPSMPAELASLAGENLLVSRASFLLAFPMLFFMGAASHLPLLGR